jgi:hypothetical protein
MRRSFRSDMDWSMEISRLKFWSANKVTELKLSQQNMN